MSAAEALRRCPEAVFVRPRHASTGSTRRRSGRPSARSSRGSSGPGSTRATSTSASCSTSFAGARRLAEAVQVAVRGATSLSCSLGVSTSKVVCKVASDRRKPGGITVVPPGREARFLAPFPCACSPASARARRSGWRLRVVDDRRLAALSDVALRAVLPGQVGRLLRDRARGIDPRDLELDVERVSISTEETFERDLTDRAALHAELRRMAIEVAATCCGATASRPGR